MSFSTWDTYTPCSWEKSQTCVNKFAKCESCNQTQERQGFSVFSNNIKNYYEIDKVRMKRYKKIYK